MFRAPHLLFSVAALALVLASCGSHSPAVRACEGAQLSVTFALNHGVALGNRHGTVELRNTGRNACTVRGYLSLQLRDLSGRRQPTDVHDGPTYFESDPGPRALVLRPNGGAAADVAWSIEPSQNACEPQSKRLEISLPGVEKHATVRFDDVACAHGRLFTDALHAR